MSCPKSSRLMSEDFLGNLPDNVADEILERLPILTAARTSVLSKQWGRNWLSLKRLVFDLDFWTAKYQGDVRNCEAIISSILLKHDGPIHEFILYVPQIMNYSQWLSFLSKNHHVKVMIITDPFGYNYPIGSYIFSFTYLVHLELVGFMVNHPPADFKGFPNLNHLQLVNIRFSHPGVFDSLTSNCRELSVLRLENFTGLDHIVIDVPTLQSLTVIGQFHTLGFGTVRDLKILCVQPTALLPTADLTKTFNAVYLLTRLCKLESVQLNFLIVKLLAVGVNQRSLPVWLNHLKKLCLSDVILAEFRDFGCVVWMIGSCPYIKELDISVVASNYVYDEQHNLDYNKNHKLTHLLKVTMTGINGSRVELKLIECLLAISPELEEFWYRCNPSLFNTLAERNVFKALTGFTRTSTKARLLCLEF